jgi:hypothetical protein
MCCHGLHNITNQPSPSRLKQAREKSGCSTRLGPMCDVTAKGASERIADFSIFNIAPGKNYIQLFQLRLSTSKVEKSNTSAKGCWEP